ncbi:MAG TPA: hypothetical protein VF298_01680 [Bacteroidales bacterium]
MKGFKSNIEKDTLKNENFRKVLYTIYAPPHHQDGLINMTKKDAEENDVEFDGKTTE